MKLKLKTVKFYLAGAIILCLQTAKAQWAPLGEPDSAPISLGFDGGVKGLCTDPSGNVYVSTITSQNSRVAKFSNGSWTELGGPNTSTFSNTVIDRLVSDPQGNIYAGFLDNGGSSLPHVKKWNGNSWSQLGGSVGVMGTYINTMLFHNNLLYVAGSFLNALTFGSYYVAVWNGSTWSELGGPNISPFKSSIRSIAVDSSGFIYAAGDFRNDLNKYYVARFNGNSWQELGGTNASDFNNTITTITTDGNGNLYAAGRFTNANEKSYVAKWNGSSWTELGGTNSSNNPTPIEHLITDNQGKVYMAGWKRNSLGKYMVQVWDGSTWSELGGINTSYMNDFTGWLSFDSQYMLYATGGFRNAFGHRHVAYINTTTGVSDELKETAGWVFPNPSKDFISLKQAISSGEQTYEIINSIGKSVDSGSISGAANSIPVKSLASGIYSLKLSGRNARNYRFVRE